MLPMLRKRFAFIALCAILQNLYANEKDSVDFASTHSKAITLSQTQDSIRHIESIPLRLWADMRDEEILDIASHPKWKALLHYRGNSSLIPKKSHFFLSKKGYKNPLDELEATLTLLDSIKGQEQFFCHYPARAKFLAIFFPHIESLKPQILCEAYDEFRIIVPRDKISLVFAAESDIYPGSAMGHIYLALQGRAKQDFHKVFSEREVLDVHKGQENWL